MLFRSQYPEFQEAGAHLRSQFSLSPQRLRNQIAFRSLCEELNGSESLEQIVATLERIAIVFEFDGLQLQLDRSLAETLNGGSDRLLRDLTASGGLTAHPERYWMLAIPFGGSTDNGARVSLALYRELCEDSEFVRLEIPIDALRDSLGPAFQRISALPGRDLPAQARVQEQ